MVIRKRQKHLKYVCVVKIVFLQCSVLPHGLVNQQPLVVMQITKPKRLLYGSLGEKLLVEISVHPWPAPHNSTFMLNFLSFSFTFLKFSPLPALSFILSVCLSCL